MADQGRLRDGEVLSNNDLRRIQAATAEIVAAVGSIPAGQLLLLEIP